MDARGELARLKTALLEPGPYRCSRRGARIRGSLVLYGFAVGFASLAADAAVALNRFVGHGSDPDPMVFLMWDVLLTLAIARLLIRNAYLRGRLDQLAVLAGLQSSHDFVLLARRRPSRPRVAMGAVVPAGAFFGPTSTGPRSHAPRSRASRRRALRTHGPPDRQPRESDDPEHVARLGGPAVVPGRRS